jgi:hypothetical protein
VTTNDSRDFTGLPKLLSQWICPALAYGAGFTAGVTIPRPNEWRKIFWSSISYTVLILGFSLSVVLAAYFAQSYFKGNHWIVLLAAIPALWFTGSLVKRLEHRHLDQKWKQALHKWYSLYYCGSCGVVFMQNEDRIMSIEEVQAFLGK